ncbi:MAG: hypothetical protein ACK47B_28210 [Armatimonadota bacterium]
MPYPLARRAFCLAALALATLAPPAAAGPLTDRELDSIGRRIWQNECGGRRDGLTSWNAGEQFASLGIGHFIWYPSGKRGPFDEAFPGLASYLAENGADVPAWVLDRPCPWSTRAEFQADFRSPRMNELRDLLASTIRLQTQYIVQRMEASLPKVLAAAPAAQREKVRTGFERMLGSSRGTFALIDYVNFKGEGIKETERYQGHGWGLLQVLAGMKGTTRDPVKEFSDSAVAVLTRRVKNSPPARGEARWLTGWKNRVRAYTR